MPSNPGLKGRTARAVLPCAVAAELRVPRLEVPDVGGSLQKPRRAVCKSKRAARQHALRGPRQPALSVQPASTPTAICSRSPFAVLSKGTPPHFGALKGASNNRCHVGLPERNTPRPSPYIALHDHTPKTALELAVNQGYRCLRQQDFRPS